MWILYIIVGSLAFLLFIVGNVLLSGKKKIKRLSQSLSMVLFLVKKEEIDLRP